MTCKTSPIANKNSPCSGKYGKTLNVKLIDSCNANCKFCVEKEGKESDEQINTQSLIDSIMSSDAQNIMLLGGEPTLYRNMKDLLKGISSKKVYLTTNGIRLNIPYVVENSMWLLSGLNISIHSYNEEANGMILNTLKHPKFQTLKDAIKLIHDMNPLCNIRINSVMTKGNLDNIEAIFKMTELAKFIGVNQIKFSEIQGEDHGQFVFAKEVFKDIFDVAEEAFTGGCEDLHMMDGIQIIIRQACGYASSNKPFPGGKHQYKDYSVLYPDGEITKGWKSANSEGRCDSTPPDRCAGDTEIKNCGVYQGCGPQRSSCGSERAPVRCAPTPPSCYAYRCH